MYFFPFQIYFIRYKDGKKPGETPSGAPGGASPVAAYGPPPSAATAPQYGVPAQKQGY
jgi:hypothetical protein